MHILAADYLPIMIFLALAVGLGIVLILAAVVLAVRNPDPEKVSAYECGFDLEVAFLFPWAVSFQYVGTVGFWSMIVFLGVLTVGFAYEWKKGALEWE